MKDHARDAAVPFLCGPADACYLENTRRFQGCPTVAVTRGGRIFVGWYAGGPLEPHMENYNLLVMSDDGGISWSAPLLIIPSTKEPPVHALDIQLFTEPDGTLCVFWVQNNTHPCGAGECEDGTDPFRPYVIRDGYVFDDFRHTVWCATCRDPDAERLSFDPPRCLGIGFLRTKPLLLANGTRLYYNYDQIDPEMRYGYSISDDGGKTLHRHYGPRKLETRFDEAMAYERRDGSIRMLARAKGGRLSETVSHDGGLTWEEARPSDIVCADTRFFVGRTPTGRLLLVTNDSALYRERLTVFLSEDDGASWPYRALVDARLPVSYPDVDFYDGRILLVYDYHRSQDGEILFASFTEEDIIKGRTISPRVISRCPV